MQRYYGQSIIIIIVFSILLLAGFFLPWVNWEGQMIPGYAMPSGNFFSVSSDKFSLDNPYPRLDTLLKIFWLIPASALAVILLAVMKKNTTAFALTAGVLALSLATVYVLFTRTLLMLGVGTSISGSLSIGFYVSVLASIGIILSGANFRPWLRLFILLIGPLAAWIGFIIIEKKTAGETYDDSSTVKSAYTVWSQDLIREFRENDSLANTKYREQILTVTGRVSETEAPNDSTINIKISDSTGSFAIFPFLAPYVEKARQLKPGDSVMIKASCSGGIYSDILETETITFKRCALIQ